MSTTTEQAVTEPTFEGLATRVDKAVAALAELEPALFIATPTSA